jgi:predicted  nucleic acid-binding Zn-ribbon protein
MHQLDLKYRGAMHQTDLIIKDEEARRLKLLVLVLRDDAATLRDQLADRDSRIHQLSKQYDDVRSQLDVMKQTCQDQENQLRSQAQQHTELKVHP